MRKLREDQDAIYFDAFAVISAGTDYPVGTRQHPVNNGPDLRAILVARELKKIILLSDFTLDDDMPGLVWESESEAALPSSPSYTIDFNGFDVDGGIFHHLIVDTSSHGGDIYLEDCCITELVEK
jgi:hypothetical protein